MRRKKNYPANLLTVLHLNELLGTDIDYEKLTEDQMKGVEYMLSALTERERTVLHCRYRDGMTGKEITARYHLTEKRVRSIIEEAFKKIRVEAWLFYAANGYEANRKRMKEQLKTAESVFCTARGITDRTHIFYQGIECLDLPVKIDNSLKRAGIRTVRELLIFICSDGHARNFGGISFSLVCDRLKKENLLPENFSKCSIAPVPRLDLETIVFRKLNGYEYDGKEREGRKCN